MRMFSVLLLLAAMGSGTSSAKEKARLASSTTSCASRCEQDAKELVDACKERAGGKSAKCQEIVGNVEDDCLKGCKEENLRTK